MSGKRLAIRSGAGRRLAIRVVRAFAVVYTLAMLGAGGVLVWAADFHGNSLDPTPWPLAAVIVFVPPAAALVGAVLRVPWPRPALPGSVPRVIGLLAVGLLIGLLAWGGVEVVHDATACEADDDCIVLPTSGAIAALAAAWATPALYRFVGWVGRLG